MSARRAQVAAAICLLGVLCEASRAAAFCGFFVSGASDELKNNASQVVLLRNGSHTVMTMSNNYQGPPQDFAMVVPVPVILQESQVKTLDPEVLRRIDQISAPRLVEYWEEDPCSPGVEANGAAGIGLGGLGTIGRGSGSGLGGLGVRVEAQFSVGEYQIVILSAQESGGLDKWLRLSGYKIPQGAAAALAPYIREQMKFFVAKVDIKKVRRDSHGLVVLSPLRFSFDASELRLPVRLGLLNASGAQDLLVYILHPTERFEVANYPNVFIPTNIEVTDAVRKSFPGFYAELFDATLQKHNGRAVVTEYAWQTSSCDPCPIPPLSDRDMVTLGANESKDGNTADGTGEVTPGMPTSTGALNAELIRRVTRRHHNEILYCYEKELRQFPSAQGRLNVKFEIGEDGNVAGTPSATAAVGQSALPALEQCVASATRRWVFPKGKTSVELAYTLKPGGARVMRGFGGQRSYVLTRLHTRYDRKALSEDLIFRTATPVIGGRANWDGTVGDQGAQEKKDSVNNFQGRYIIRHYWEDKVTCAKPVYGRWGGRPVNMSGGAPTKLGQAQPGMDLANAPRGQVSLRAVVRTAVPSLGLAGQPAPNRPPPSP